MSILNVTRNRRAFHEYEISDRLEAGLVLMGTEVKAIRHGQISLTEAWIDLNEGGEAYLKQAYISGYRYGNVHNHQEVRPRKLLLKRAQLKRLSAQVARKGYTLVPLSIYIKGQYIKVEVGLGKGKKTFDKRESEKQKDADRDIERAFKSHK